MISNKELAEIAQGNGQTFHPPKVWGLNFHFNLFNKFYIKDILQMKPYHMFPGAFEYNYHPIYKVDILGVIVRRDEKSKVFIYAVDDGTGVISCCCWKQPFSANAGQSEASDLAAQLPDELHCRLEKLQGEQWRKEEGYELGDLVHMRGKLKTFRDMMEIVAYYHRRVDNPTAQTRRMRELPDLYQHSHDKPWVMPYKVQQEVLRLYHCTQNGTLDEEHLIQKLMMKIQEVLERQGQNLREFSIPMLLDVPEISAIAGETGEKLDRREAVRKSLIRMETEKGTVFRRRFMTPEYENLCVSCPLDRVVLDALRTECAKPRYREKGCHYLHIVDELKDTVEYSKLRAECVLHVLERLETNSDVIRVTDKCYLPL